MLIQKPYKQLWPAQRALIACDAENLEYDIACYQGGYGSGKTFIGSLLGLLISWRRPGSRGLVVAKTFPLLRDTTLETYFEHLERCQLREGPDYIWRASQAKLIFPQWGGSEILFRHLQSPGKLKSLNLSWIHCEEMSQITESDFLMLLSRLRQENQKPYRFFGTTNPQEQADGWMQHYFYKAPPNDNTKIRYRRVIASTRENKALPAEYVTQLERVFHVNQVRMWIDGQDTKLMGNRVCYAWQADKHVQALTYDPNHRLYLTCDFNIDPMCWVIAQRIDGNYHFIDEICLPTCTTIQAAQEFVQRYGGHPAGITLTGDASGQQRSVALQTQRDNQYTVIQKVLMESGFSDSQIDLPKANPSVQNRVHAWNALLENSAGVQRIFVDPKCQRLIENCETLRYVTGSSTIWEPSYRQILEDQSDRLKYTKHPFDAASYFVCRYDAFIQPKTYPKQQLQIQTSGFLSPWSLFSAPF